MSCPTILVAGVFHEAHSFSPTLTGRENFALVVGDEVISKGASSASVLGGGYRQLRSMGAKIAPALSAVAAPGGLVQHDVYLELKEAILSAAKRVKPDGVFLDLHGAMATTELDDADGDLLAALRDELSPGTPISVGLDMHGCLTSKMLAAAPLCVACKHNPHTDYAEAGARAARLMLESMSGKVRPVTSAIWLPCVLVGKMGTASGPLRELHDLRLELEGQAGVLDISIYNTYTFSDSAEAGQCVTVITDNDAESGHLIARRLAKTLWNSKEEYTLDRPTLDEALAEAKKGELTILGDYGDRVLGGAAGDGTYILNYLREHRPDLRAVVPITDPDAVRIAHKAGVGREIDIRVGGSISPLETPTLGTWRVERLGDGNFVLQGPWLANEPAKLGDTAVLSAANLTLLVTSAPGFTQDPEAFRSNGIDFKDFDVVVSKSGFHYMISFAGIGKCVSVETPGMSACHPETLPFKRRGPFWPVYPDIQPDFSASAFALPQ